MTLLDRGTIERALTFSGDAPLLLALSGGGDFVALLHLLAEEIGPARLRACVVDHGLRTGSAEDARRARGLAEKLGVEARIATLTWPEASKRTQQEARTARYRALCGAAREIGAQGVVLAHTRDDQAETVLLRAGAGSGWRGLNGIAAFKAAPLWPEGRGLFVARPVLGARRDALRALLRERGGDWIEDPSNENTAFARVRVRQRLAGLKAEGLDPMRFAALAERLAPLAAMLDRAVGSLIETAVVFDGPRARIDLASWTGDTETRTRALAILIAAVSGKDRESAPQGLSDVEAALTGAGFKGATLGGARLRPMGLGVVLERDKGAVLGRRGGKQGLASLALPAKVEAVWDKRLALTAREAGWSVEANGEADPVLVKGEVRLQLGDAPEVTWRWLLGEHVAHRIGAV